MNRYLEILHQRLSIQDAELLNEIYEPKVVAIPYSNAFRSLCIMPDGEIRCYGQKPLTDLPTGEFIPVYLSSKDCGLSWKEHKYSLNTVGASVQSPWNGKYLSVDYGKTPSSSCIVRIGDTPDCSDYTTVNLPHQIVGYHAPYPIETKKRWLIAGSYNGHTVVFISDDDGYTWKTVNVEKTDKFQIKPPHKGIRWENSGLEPSMIELKNNRLMMILRTSTDYHYVTYSDDYGDSWSAPVATDFHSTLTTPYLLRMSNGEIVFFYNNSKPLPEQDKKNVFPPLSQDEIDGVWADVFTNRDANCVAFSNDECKSWKGFRELYLNPIRNSCDFRTCGGNGSGNDKSVHQFEAIELPNNKILVHVGQHEFVRKLIIFDINWLKENCRKENFRHGLQNVSTQVYLKSVSGGFRGFSGHCAWNRTNGAVPVPDPSGDHTEAILIKNTNDDRLISNAQGLVWNFPATTKGEVSIKLKVKGKGLRISLMDYWQNPIDMTVKDDSQITTVITKNDTSNTNWDDIIIRFDATCKKADLYINNIFNKKINFAHNAPNGLCYLHLQTVSDFGDDIGTLIKSLNFTS